MENKELKFFNLCLSSIQAEKGLNLSEIADQLNVTLSYLSKVKTGKKPVSAKLLFDIRKLAGMTNTKAINMVTENMADNTQAAEPSGSYASKAMDTDLILHFIKDSSAKTVQIDQLINELSKANTTISILANKIKS
jgi:transcriptional regulator with XRE-family HTH domain